MYLFYSLIYWQVPTTDYFTVYNTKEFAVHLTTHRALHAHPVMQGDLTVSFKVLHTASHPYSL